ncbi:liprin-alpha-1-like [Hydractinia symbiolongicarpus]|uniref:liprin-alpha-1-like n=1 Tax=Hydractinia symbiolongicarpus TaxID=13093 RepID=UPI0025504165|nr:liprin-alpha-1-like [Hydractinia symbiolongicarpus]
MICDIMPTLSEDGDMPGDGSMEDNNFEQLMVNMLDERDKLMETLRETQENLTNAKTSLKETELERDTLLNQFDLVLQKCDLDREHLIRKLSSYDSDEDSVIAQLKQQRFPLAEEFVSIAKEYFQAKEKVDEQSEEIAELKAERSNTKLLLEHLESLVSRHERSLRMTVVKRQAQSSAGVSSEVEVLKALKSLFEHHKALDEKVRERLRIAVEKANNLEEDLAAANQEIEHLQHEQKLARERRQNGQVPGGGGKSLENGPLNENVEDLREEISDLKYQLDQKQREIEKTKKESKESKDRVSNLEEQINTTNKKASFSFESSQKLQRELEEALAQKGDLEERMMTLEKRYVRSQNELSSSNEDSERGRAESMGLKTLLEQREEKIKNLQEQCKFYEMKCSQSMKHAEELPKIQQELESRKAALNAAEERNFTAEEQLQNLQFQLEEITADLQRTKEREQMTESHNQKLQSTVDKLLSESSDRLQNHMKEKMQTLDEKNVIVQELDKLKAINDEYKRTKIQMSAELDKLRQEVMQLRKQAYIGSTMSSTPYATPSKDESIRLASPKEPTWQKMNQANVVSNVSKALVSRQDNMDGSDKGSVTGSIISTVPSIVAQDSLETLNSNDAQKLANVLQQQLDAINEELEMLQVEHRTTERLTEQIEKRVGSETNSLDEVSVASSKESDKTERNKNHVDSYQRTRDLNTRRESDEANNSFLFTSYDPLDTKPLMLNIGRSHEQLAEADTPSSQPSDSTESEGSERSKVSIPWGLSSSYEAESFDFSSSPSSITSSMESLTRRGVKNRSLKNSLGKIFSTKGKLKPRDLGISRSDDLDSNAETQRDAETRMKKKLLEDVIASGAPFGSWNAPTILAWLELWVKLPEWYIQACRANVKSGSIMSALSDFEIQHEIGVNNQLHRMKLRLAIHEMVNVTNPVSPPSMKTSLVFGDMNHFWIASEWLASLGLPQYKYHFIENLVDARMLEHITKKDYTKYLKVVDNFHRTSLACGTKCLEALNYDRKFLEKRRQDADGVDKDVLVWSNARVIKWATKIGLEDYAEYLRQSGVHGAVIALDENFDVETFAYYLQIPSTNEKVRGILEREYNKLLILCHEYKSPPPNDLGDGDFKRSKSWRKKFKKDKSLKDKSRNARGSSSDQDVHTSDLMSPSRRPKKSPLMERKHYNIRGGPS